MYQKTVLPNGVRVVTEELPHAPAVSIGLWVETGSRSEDPQVNGICHFIEHLLFKGTKTRKAMDIAREIDSVGGALNAFTGRESTCAYAKVLPHDLRLGMALLADIYMNSVFHQEEIEKERNVVLQEISMVEDTPDDLIHDLFCQGFWRGHPLGRPVLGTAETVAALRREHIVSHFRTTYLPKSLVVAAAGRLKHRRAVRLVEEILPLPSLRPPHQNGGAPRCYQSIHVTTRPLEQVHLVVGTKGIPQAHPMRHACNVLNTILGGGMSSRLFQEVREKRGLAYTVYSFQYGYSDAGMLGVYAGTSQDQLPRVIDLVLRELRSLKRRDVTKNELKLAKEQIKGNLLLGTESADSHMMRIARNEIAFGREVSIEESLRDIDRVTPDEIRFLANELFREEYLSLTVLGRVRRRDLPRDALCL
ncbi:MAG: insulinase family protein [Deltaproteobacteria bacterium]|nr:insulinase family protein [Deltaproteobacteria bacterium]